MRPSALLCYQDIRHANPLIWLHYGMAWAALANTGQPRGGGSKVPDEIVSAITAGGAGG